jgi:hypothetical protein
VSADKHPQPQQPPEPPTTSTPRRTPSPQHDNGKPQWRPFPWSDDDGEQRELPPFTG